LTPRLLITNDDGVDSIGLHVLARAMNRHGDVVVAAPNTEYSGAGAALGALHVMHPEVRRASIDGVETAWSVTGPPGLCVMFARLGVFGGHFDLVVSGINPGANVGRAVYHSGTVGAVLTGRNGGVSGVAVSQAVAGFGVEGQGWDEMIANQRWETAAEVASAVVGGLLAAPPHEPVVVNLNVLNLPMEELRGWRYTEVGLLPPRAIASAWLVPIAGLDQTYSVKMEWGEEIPLPPDTDGGAVERDEVSVSYLSRMVAEARPDLARAEAALADLLGTAGPTLAT
jgi:5'-nucleotidase